MDETKRGVQSGARQLEAVIISMQRKYIFARRQKVMNDGSGRLFFFFFPSRLSTGREVSTMLSRDERVFVARVVNVGFSFGSSLSFAERSP